MTLIEASGLGVDYGAGPVLSDVDFKLAEREIVTVVGPNGSGKTTFLRALIGAQPASTGSVRQQPGMTIGYVPQRLEIDRTLPLTIDRFLSLPRRRPHAALASALDRVGLSGLGGTQLAALSGGQMQRALLARALVVEPNALVLDEPTQGLDQPGEAAFYRLIEDLRQDLGCAVLMVGHDLHVVMGAADRVICLNGHICCEGAPTVIAEQPEYRALFGLGTQGALALYRHEHDHSHEHGHGHGHEQPHDHAERDDG